MHARSQHHPPATATPEVSLLLRAHSEQSWLSREVAPVVRQIATREGLPEEQLPAALAYLEVIWSEAVRRAGDTDKALTCLDLSLPSPQAPDCIALAARARRYRAAVLVLREATLQRVAPLLGAPGAGRLDPGWADPEWAGNGSDAPLADGYPASSPSSSSSL